MKTNLRRFTRLILVGLLAGCVVADIPPGDLFPPEVGDYLRTSGPAPDPATGVDQAIYQGPGGIVRLSVNRVGADQVDYALSELPPMAINVGYDEALGPRDGVFFTFAQEYHAAWGNGDWVFIISATSEGARGTFLAFYGF